MASKVDALECDLVYMLSARAALKTNPLKYDFSVAPLNAPRYQGMRVMKIIMILYMHAVCETDKFLQISK